MNKEFPGRTSIHDKISHMAKYCVAATICPNSVSYLTSSKHHTEGGSIPGELQRQIEAPRTPQCHQLASQAPVTVSQLPRNRMSPTYAPSPTIHIAGKDLEWRYGPYSRMNSPTGNGGSARVSLEEPADLDALPPALAPDGAADIVKHGRKEGKSRTENVTKGNAKHKIQPTQAQNGIGTRRDLMNI